MYEQSGDLLTDYQVLFELTGSNFPANAQTDGDDIRFTDSSGTELSYWIEEGDYAAEEAKIWVKVPSIPASGETTVTMWYGNPSAGGVSDFDNTFTKDYAESGLAGLWHFDEGSGSIVTDSSGNGNTGTIHGASWAGSDGGQWDGRSDVKFSKGNCLRFDGSDDYVVVSNTPGLSFSGAFSVETRIYHTGRSSDHQNIVSRQGTTEVNERSFVLFWSPAAKVDGLVFIIATDANSGGIGAYSQTSISLNQWYHVVGVYDGSEMRLYINSVLDPNFPIRASGTLLNTDKPVRIGLVQWIDQDRNFYFNGNIDEVHIYDRALSADEIKAHYEKREYASVEPTLSIGPIIPITTPSLSITKTASPSTIQAGETTTITIAIENKGDGTATDVSVSDAIPREFQLTSGSTTQDYDTIKTGEYRTFEYTLEATATGRFVLDPATAEYSDEQGKSYSDESDPVTINVESTITPTPTPTPEPTPTPGTPQITISHTTLYEKPKVGEKTSITVSIENTGTGDAKNIKLREHIPSGLSINSVDGAESTGNIVTWSGDLELAQTHAVKHSLKVLTEGDKIIEATVTYEDIEGKEYTTSTTIVLEVEPDIPIVTPTPAPKRGRWENIKDWIPYLIILVAVVLGGIAIIAAVMRKGGDGGAEVTIEEKRE
jgi:uncharacterized repeat protein (TIGR01451 family)